MKNIKIKHNEIKFQCNYNSLQSRKQLMDNIFHRLNLKTLDEFLNISRKKIIQNGGKTLLLVYYSNNLEKLLSSMYPHFPWRFSNLKPLPPHLFFRKVQNQHLFMENLFTRLKLISLDDWLKISRNKIKENGGKIFLQKIHENNMQKLLFSLYPNFPWKFENLKTIKTKKYFENSIFNQIQVIEKLYKKFKLYSLEDWLKISYTKINDEGGKIIMKEIYSNDLIKLLSTIYPNFPWQFWKLKFNSKLFFKSIFNQRLFMDYLYDKFKLNNLNDWFQITRKQIIKNKGKFLIKFYNNNYKELLLSIYPFYPWQFNHLNLDLIFYNFNYNLNNNLNINRKKSNKKNIFYHENRLKYHRIGGINLIEKQRELIDSFYYFYHFQSFEEFYFITRKQIYDYAGATLINYHYENNLFKLLFTIYPNYPWEIDRFCRLNSKKYFEKIENQTKFLEKLFYHLKLNSLAGWLNITKKKFIKNGGEILIKNFYENNMQKMLFSIYKNYPWHFENFFIDKNEFFYLKIREMKEKYFIEEKRDWYRLPMRIDQINARRLLANFYPNEKWEKKLFFYRSKKTIQRILYSYLKKIYYSYLIYESYRPPYLKIYDEDSVGFEFDIFIPNLNLAIEYQGEQHYDDISNFGFGSIELYQNRDKMKESLAIFNGINLINIPFWWDKSLFSLQTTLNDYLLLLFRK